MPEKVWSWQDRAVDFLLTVEKHAYISAPTGTGKTNFMFKAIEAIPGDGARIIVVGMSDLVAQHRERFAQLGAVETNSLFQKDEADFKTPLGHHVIITTWQSLARAETNPIGSVDLLFFDECHIGGSDDTNTSIPKLLTVFQPSMKVYVSATIQTANEALLGQKSGHVFLYRLAEAYEDNLLHPVDLVEVHTGTRADLANIETNTGLNVEQLEEKSSGDLDDLARQLRDLNTGFDSNSFQAISTQRHDAMIEIYMSLHADDAEQALFFCPEISRATSAAKRFNSFARRRGKNVRAEAVHTKNANYSTHIRRFRKGEITALFVVGMLQEGFDLPSLRLGFDCRFFSRWNDSKRARFIQKIGRLIRSSEGKKRSLYYYARDITDFYNPRLAKTKTPHDPTFSDEITSAEVVAAGISAAADGDVSSTTDIEIFPAEIREITVDELDNIPVNAHADSNNIEEYKPPIANSHISEINSQILSQKKVTVTITPLYILRDVRDHALVRTINFQSLFNKDVWLSEAVAEKCEEWIRMAKAGEPRPLQSTDEGRLLTSWLHRNKIGMPSDFEARLRQANPNWFRSRPSDVEQECELWVQKALSGEQRPPQKTREGARLSLLLQQKTAGVPIDFKARIAAANPEWLRIANPNTVLQECLSWVQRAKSGEVRPDKKSANGKRLLTLLHSRPPKGVPANFREQLREANPSWFPVKNDEEITRECYVWINLAKSGAERPPKSSREGARLSALLTKPPAGVPNNFRELLREANPNWFRKSDAAIIEECEYWINFAKTGNSRPGKNSVEGQRLTILLSKQAPAGVPTTFREDLKAANPLWFRREPDDIAEECETWIKRAESGASRSSFHDAVRLQILTSKNPPKGVPLDFKERLKSIAPSWFQSSDDDLSLEIKSWLERAKSGEKRPLSNTKEGRRLAKLLSNVEFKKHLRAVNTTWLASDPIDVAEECQRFIESAKLGNVRPSSDTVLGRRLVTLLAGVVKGVPKNFKNELRKANASWFKKSAEDVLSDCNRFIEMAKRGEARPKQDSVEGRRLNTLLSTTPVGVPDNFKERLKRANPSWFRIRSEEEIKSECHNWIKAASSGKPRPDWASKEGRRLRAMLNGEIRAIDNFESLLNDANPRWLNRK